MFIFTIYSVILKLASCEPFFGVESLSWCHNLIKISAVIFSSPRHSLRAITRGGFVPVNTNCVKNTTYWKCAKVYSMWDTLCGWFMIMCGYCFGGIAFMWDFRIMRKKLWVFSYLLFLYFIQWVKLFLHFHCFSWCIILLVYVDTLHPYSHRCCLQEKAQI